MSDNATRAPCTVPPLVRKHILGTQAFRPRALPGGGHDMVLIHGCRCAEGERRGPDGGVCGACGGAIPNASGEGARSMSVPSTALLAIVARLDASRQQQREWAENAADQKQHDWAARYTSVADAYTEAIDAINELIANNRLSGPQPAQETP